MARKSDSKPPASVDIRFPPGLNELMRIERDAISLLASFEECTGPAEGAAAFTRGDETRYFRVKPEQHSLFALLQAFFALFHEAAQIYEGMKPDTPVEQWPEDDSGLRVPPLAPGAARADRLVMLTMSLASIAADLGVRLTDRTYDVGRRVCAGGQSGTLGAAMTNENYIINQTAYQPLINQFQQQGLGYKAAIQKLEDESEYWLGQKASARTIEKYTEPLFRKRPGRPRKKQPKK